MGGFEFRKASDFTERYAKGSVTPTEVAERCLEAVAESDRQDPPLRAFISQRREDVLSMAAESAERYKQKKSLGPLDGVPVAIKDEVHQKGYPTTVGTSFLGQKPAAEDAETVRRLRAAGAVFLGKTNMHEVGLGTTGINPHHGAARNPYNPGHITGGSSSGSAAAVAAGFCPMALGADGGGSIRIPAGFCGLTGIKGTFGRVSEHGAAPLCWSVAHIGPLAGTVADAALMFSIMAGPDPKEPPTWGQPELKLDGALKGEVKGLRLGICPDFFDQADEEVQAVIRKAIDKLKDKGAEVVELKIDALEYVRVVQYVIIGCEMAAALFEHRKAHKRDFASDTRMLLELASNVPAVDYIRAQRLRTRICRGFDEALKKADVILSPTTGTTAAPIKPKALRHGESDEAVLEANTHFSFAANQTGLPALAVPAGYDSAGLPVGLQVTGRAWEEATIVKVAAAVEQTLTRRRPARYWDLLK